MKKGIKFTAATVMALSAITPVAAFADEIEVEVQDGYYTLGGFVSTADFAAKTKAEKKAFILEHISANGLVLVLKGQVYDLTNEEIQNAAADEVEKLAVTTKEYTATSGNDLTQDGIVTPDIGVITAYEAALAAVNEEDYTPESWAAYQEVVKANAVTAKNNQEKIDAATAAITAAQASLEKVLKDLKVESVSAINTTGVKVTFPALAEAIEGATIVVKDNTGATKEVKPVNLVKGETTATFTFVNPLGSEPTGLWTVDGVQVDLDLQAKLDKVYDADNEVKLLASLQALELEDVNADNISFYSAKLTELKKEVAKADFTKADAQKVVTEGNEAALTDENIEAIVEAVEAAKNQVALLEALQNDAFKRVNAEWISNYWSALNAFTGTTYDKDDIETIQLAIDAKNKTEYDAAYNALKLGHGTDDSLKATDLNKVKTLLTDWMPEDAEGETAKADRLTAIEVQLAVVKVVEAETPAQLTSALNALKAVDFAYELDMDIVKDANRSAYINGVKDAAGAWVKKGFKDVANADKNSIGEIVTIITDINNSLAAAPISKINAAATALNDGATTEEKDALLKALQDYSDIKRVSKENKDVYATLLASAIQAADGLAKGFDDADTKEKIQELVDLGNLIQVKAKADVVATTATTLNQGTVSQQNELLKALNDYGLLKDVATANKIYYATNDTNATDASFAADIVIATTFTLATVSSTNITDAKAALQAEIDRANIYAVQDQLTAAGVLNKLNLISGLKNIKAENASQYLKDADSAIAALDDSMGNERTVTKLDAALKVINDAQIKVVGVKALNAATTATEVMDILTELVVNGSVTADDYKNASSADKLIIAELFMSDDVFTSTGLVGSRTAEFGKYDEAGISNVATDLAALATAFKAVPNGINTLFGGKAIGHSDISISEVQAKLDNLKKANYTAYDALSGTKKLAVAEELINAFPVNADKDKYTSYASTKVYFDAVDAAIKAVAE